jgi:glycosyltransferase involved in cell wall biosynthesis
VKRRLVILTEIIAPYRIPVFNALAERAEIDLHVIFLSETDTSTRRWHVYTNEIRFSYEVLPSWRRRWGKHNILVNQSVVSALAKARPEIILCGGYNYLASWQAMRWAKQNSVPFLLWCESTARDRRGGHFLVQRLKQNFFSNCDGFVVPGRSSLEYVLAMGVHPGQVFKAPNAVDIELFSKRAELARQNAYRLRGHLGLPDRYFLFVGRLVKSKGVLDLLAAYTGLGPELRSGIGVVFAGDGPLRAQLEASARAIFPGAIHFPGFVHRDELADYYALAECFVFPTHSDPWGLVVNEAMACGLPVICTDVAGCAADLVKQNGILVPAMNTGRLAQGMEKMAQDIVARDHMSLASSTLIQGYSPDSCAAGIVEAVAAQTRPSNGHKPRLKGPAVEPVLAEMTDSAI